MQLISLSAYRVGASVLSIAPIDSAIPSQAREIKEIWHPGLLNVAVHELNRDLLLVKGKRLNEFTSERSPMSEEGHTHEAKSPTQGKTSTVLNKSVHKRL
jgi:hypothetical protein